MTDNGEVVILTALDLEYEAVLEHLTNVENRKHEAGTRFQVGEIQGTKTRVVLGSTGVGNGSAAILSERAMQMFAPTAVLFVGVAGALLDSAKLGDVVVASKVYAYHGGTSDDDGFKSRPRAWEPHHAISELAREVSRSRNWTKRLADQQHDPKVHFKPIAAGEVVQNSRTSAQAQMIHERYNDAMAIEMEAAGIAQAGHLNNAQVVVVRGISDRADGSKGTSNDAAWQPRAAAHAAAFAIHLAEQLTDEKAADAMTSREPKANGTTHSTVYNVSSGTVGIQAANVHGSTVWMNTQTTNDKVDVFSAIADLREQLDRSHSTGEVDDDTYQDACTELRTAEATLQHSDTKSNGKSVRALKKLRGLVTDSSDIAANVARVITVVKELS